jgi:taurine--2-oxoglutarate transaminase
VRIARHASKKSRGIIVTRDRSYHGATYMPMALSGDARTAHQVDAEAWGVRHVPPPYAYRCPWGTSTPEDAAAVRRAPSPRPSTSEERPASPRC